MDTNDCADYVTTLRLLTETVDKLIKTISGSPFGLESEIMDKVPLLDFYNDDLKANLKIILEASSQESKVAPIQDIPVSIFKYARTESEMPWGYMIFENDHQDVYVFVGEEPLTTEEINIGYIKKALYKKVS